MKVKTILSHRRGPFLAAALGGAGLLRPLAARAAEDQPVALAVTEQGFVPATIEAAAGTRVRINVTNQTAAAIEFESYELNRERVVQPGHTVAVYLSGLAPGQYEFFDDFHREHHGLLVVK